MRDAGGQSVTPEQMTRGTGPAAPAESHAYRMLSVIVPAKSADGYDVVSGWRKDRKDNTLRRTLPSRIANWIISLVSRVHLHDYGCTLKAYRLEVLEGVRLYGEMHRLI